MAITARSARLAWPSPPSKSGRRSICLFQSRIVNKKLDIVWPCEGMIAEGEFH
jgi:hypothetical protein